MAKLISYRSFLDKKLQDPEFAREYELALKEARFALALTRRREELRLTQDELAQRAGIKQPMLARYEKGQVPNASTMQKLAAALHAEIIIGADTIRIEPLAELKAA
jgi:HTH-type transcriptional regulator/antitoxin HipB